MNNKNKPRKSCNIKVKLFKRVMKELGLYYSWMTNRTYALNNDSSYMGQKVFEPIIENDELWLMVDESFWWIDAETPMIWDFLYCVFSELDVKIFDKDLFNKVKKVKDKLKESRYI